MGAVLGRRIHFWQVGQDTRTQSPHEPLVRKGFKQLVVYGALLDQFFPAARAHMQMLLEYAVFGTPELAIDVGLKEAIYLRA